MNLLVDVCMLHTCLLSVVMRLCGVIPIISLLLYKLYYIVMSS